MTAAAAWVLLGSALGGMARYWVTGIVTRFAGDAMPWGTMTVNVSGAALIGVLAANAATGGWADGIAGTHFAVIGFAGSYTTVSAFSLQTLALARTRQRARALTNVALSLALGIAAVTAGFALGTLVGTWR